MKKEDFFDMLSDINPEYVKEAHRNHNKKKTISWAKWGSIAACVALFVVCVPAILHWISLEEGHVSVVESQPIEDDKTKEDVEPSVGNNNQQEILQNQNEEQSNGKEDSGKENAGEDGLEEYKGKIISAYESGMAASYQTPDNHTFGISTPLKGALGEYGDSVRYMVVIDVFWNKEMVEDKEILEAEMRRLENLGYKAFIEVNNREDKNIYYLGIQATKEQIENFEADEAYGYFLFIRSERIGDEDAPADKGGEYNEAVTSSDVTQDTSEFFGGSYTDENGNFVIVLTQDSPEHRVAICKELGRSERNTSFVKGNYTLEYLTALQDKISAGMVNKEFPFVVSSGVYEMTNNIVISVTTQDESELARVLALDTLGGAIEVEYTEGNMAKEDILLIAPENNAVIKGCYDDPSNPVSSQNYDVGEPTIEGTN